MWALTKHTSSSAASQVANPTPYTCVLAETVIGHDGKSQKGSITTNAMRSDGATVLMLGTSANGSRLLRFPSGRRVVTNDVTRKMSSSEGSISVEERSPSGNCIGTGSRAVREVVVGHELVSGVRAVKITEKTGDRSVTKWLALDFSCTSLGFVVNHNTGEISRTELVSFVPGEPSDSLFDLPSDYVERPPSSLAPPGVTKSDSLKKRDEMLDRKYYEKRRQR